jgi:hypothetical protein
MRRLTPSGITKRVIGAVCAIAVVTCSSAAFAQNDKKSDDVQIMDFKELDKLIAQNKLPGSATIGAGHGPIRVLLVRPRLTFVPELYKSIENL